MYWLFAILIIGAAVYYLNMRNIEKKRKAAAAAPKCETCGRAMELQSTLGDSEVWVCPECSPSEE